MIQPGGAPSSQSTESSPMNVDASEGGSAETRREAGGGAQPGGAGADAGGNFDVSLSLVSTNHFGGFLSFRGRGESDLCGCVQL